MKVKSESEVAQVVYLKVIQSDPMDCSLPGSSVHGIFQARVLEWGAKLGLKRWWRKKGNFSKRGEWHEQSTEVGKNLVNS